MTLSDISDDWAGAGDSSSRLQFLGISDDGILSGNAQVIVTFTDESTYGEELTLCVDGEIYHSTRAFPEENKRAGASEEVGTFSIETYRYANGPYLLEVIDSFGNSQTRQLTFQNVISLVRYDPIFDLTSGAEDIEDKSHITALLAPPQPWEVKIINLEDEVVKSFSGSGAEINVFWEGTDANGDVVEDSSYVLTIAAIESGVSILACCINKNSL